MNKKLKIALIGVGYVGLPVAISLSKHFQVKAFDKNIKRLNKLRKGIDDNLDISKKEILKNINNIQFTNNFNKIKNCNFFIVTLPTPVNKNNIPDLKNISIINFKLSKILKSNDIVVYESTVYPGCTDNRFVSELCKYTNLEFNKDFSVGYSPERINPGDKNKTIKNINKLVSASNKKALKKIKLVYEKIVVNAKVIPTKSIIIAESAKIIENTQRDLNIALINEFSKILKKLKVPSNDVLKAANTKWNFLNFHPGLVGGHCIGVDPYYLAFAAQKNGINPKLILAGRDINENYFMEVVNDIKKISKYKNINLKKSKVLICGLAFKKNTPDLRNSQTYKIYKNLIKKVDYIDLYDPLVKNPEINKVYNKNSIKKLPKKKYDIIIITVKHDEFIKIKNKLILSAKENKIIYDIPRLLKNKIYDGTL